MKRAALAIALLATGAASAVQMASQPWVTNRITQATAATLQSAKDYADAAIAGAGGLTPEMVTNIVLDVAPAPGNYNAVSNAAMSAVQPGELVAATNDIPRVEAADPDMFPGWAQNAVGAGHADYSDDSGHADLADSARSLVDGIGTETRQSDTIFAQLDSIAGKASTNDVQLTPVYGEWTITRDGVDVTAQVPQPVFSQDQGEWWVGSSHISSDMMADGAEYGTENSTYLAWEAFADASGDRIASYSAVRVAVGYTLGSQTDKVLASTNLQTGVSAAAVTNIVHDLSLGGIWDSQLEVWWTPRMRNGSLTYEATTNVNLNAGN